MGHQLGARSSESGGGGGGQAGQLSVRVKVRVTTTLAEHLEYCTVAYRGSVRHRVRRTPSLILILIFIFVFIFIFTFIFHPDYNSK
jgi:hypothetical protein